jgi:hypothetical protein
MKITFYLKWGLEYLKSRLSVKSGIKPKHLSPNRKPVRFTQQHVISNKRVFNHTTIPKPPTVNLEPLSQGLHLLFFGYEYAVQPLPSSMWR